MIFVVGVAPFPGDKLELVNKTAELPDGRRLMPSLDDENSYVSQFGVFHQLHCLVRQIKPPKTPNPLPFTRRAYLPSKG